MKKIASASWKAGLALALLGLVAISTEANAQGSASTKFQRTGNANSPIKLAEDYEASTNGQALRVAERALVEHLVSQGPWTRESAREWQAKRNKLAKKLIEAEEAYAVGFTTFYNEEELAVSSPAYDKKAEVEKLGEKIKEQEAIKADAEKEIIFGRKFGAEASMALTTQIQRDRRDLAIVQIGKLGKQRAKIGMEANALLAERDRRRLARVIAEVNKFHKNGDKFRVNTFIELTTSSAFIRTLLGKRFKTYEEQNQRRAAAPIGSVVPKKSSVSRVLPRNSGR